MPLEYSVNYTAENHYDNLVKHAVWQFLIIPENNDNQELVSYDFTNSLNIIPQRSVNGYGFKTLRLSPKEPFRDVTFKARFSLLKKEVNPFDFLPNEDQRKAYEVLRSIPFRAEHEPFLRITPFTRLPGNGNSKNLFDFDRDLSLFQNLQALNQWINGFITFQAGITHVETILEEVLESRKGVCQDYTHLFCAISRQNGVPARYVSGYLHQGIGYVGDSQMHAWAEALVPEAGWVGFDPTNNILAGNNHLKVAHGKDYTDCSPLKGLIYAPGQNRTTHSVEVTARQAQQ